MRSGNFALNHNPNQKPMLRNYYFLPLLLLLCSTGWSSLQAQGCLGSQRVDASYELANNDVCEGSEITVRNISEEFGNTNVIYIWDWGDGQRDTISGRENVTHTYNFFDQNACTAEDGLMVLELRLDARVPGCQQFNHFVIKPIYIFLRPVAQFEAEETICLPETTLNFKNTSCTADSAATYSWNFGDPASGAANTSTAFEPSHTFSGPGIYNVSLSVNSACGSGTFVKPVEVKEPPVVQVTLEKNPTTSCIPLDVRFRNASTGGLSYEWKVTPNRGYAFLDSTNLFSFEPRMLFFESGSYRVEFTATNECGDNTWSETIEVFEPPIITLRPEPIACETLSYTPDVRYEGTVNSVRWTFSNATPATSTERMPNNIVFPPGRHLVRVEATSVCGTFEVSDTIVVLGREAVNIEPVAPVCNTAQAFTLRATPSGGVWSGRGVSPVGLFTPSAANLGMNEITYTFGPAGCTSVATINVEVKNAAPIEPGPDETICIDAQPFTLGGFSPTGGVWQGSGITDTLQGRFSPAAAGVGNARLTYSYFDAANSCVATASRTITVAPLPVVAIAEDDVAFCITPDDIRLSENIDLQVTANGGSGRWSGTGVTDTSAGIFNGRDLPPGAYVLRYDYTSEAGCMAGDSVTVNLTEKQQVIAQADTTVCINQETLTLQATPDGGRWSGRNINANNGSINLAQAGGGTFTYTYTLFANTTCEVSDEVQIEIIDLSGVSAGADVGFCESEAQVTLSGFSPAGGVWGGSGVVDNRMV